MRLSRKSPVTQARPRCFVFRSVSCCLPQPRMHSIAAPAGLGKPVAQVPGAVAVDGAASALAGRGRDVLLVDVRRHSAGPQGDDAVRSVVCLILVGTDAMLGSFTLSLSDAVRGAAFHGAVRLADLAGDRRAFPQRLQGDRRPQRCINFPSCPFAHGLLRPSIEWQSGRPPTTLPFQMPGPFRFGCPSELASPCARRPRQHAGRDGRMVRPGAEPKNVAI